jgi:hypothetical protein
MKLIHRFRQIVDVEIDVTTTQRKETPMTRHIHRRSKGFIIEGLLLLLVLLFAAIFSAAASQPAVAGNAQKPDQIAPRVNTAKTVTEGARAGDAVLHLAKDADNADDAVDAAPDAGATGDDVSDSIGDFLQGLFGGF